MAKPVQARLSSRGIEVAAFMIGCFAIALSAVSVSWQIFTWKRERRFAVGASIISEGPAFGGGRYPIRVAASNEGGTREWVDGIKIEATYDRDINRRMFFNSPELVRNPSLDRDLPPRRRFESEFNLLSRLIAGGGLPIEIVAVVELTSGREVRSKVFKPDPTIAAEALGEDPVEDLKIEGRVWDDYFPQGPHSICADCKSEIPSDARVCKFCGFRIAEQPSVGS